MVLVVNGAAPHEWVNWSSWRYTRNTIINVSSPYLTTWRPCAGPTQWQRRRRWPCVGPAPGQTLVCWEKYYVDWSLTPSTIYQTGLSPGGLHSQHPHPEHSLTSPSRRQHPCAFCAAFLVLGQVHLHPLVAKAVAIRKVLPLFQSTINACTLVHV